MHFVYYFKQTRICCSFRVSSAYLNINRCNKTGRMLTNSKAEMADLRWQMENSLSNKFFAVTGISSRV